MELPQQLASPWITKKVTITHKNGTDTSDIEVKAYGSFAVHPAIAEGITPEWITLTHVPTGLSIAHFSSEEEAMRAGEWFWSKMCMLFRERTQEAVKVRLGVEKLDRIKAWRDEMQSAGGKFFPPNLD